MRTPSWQDYELIDARNGERLERWGSFILIRPDPTVIWNGDRTDPRWKNAHARYHRSKSGGGSWEMYKHLPNTWRIGWEGLTFQIGAMGFKHTGIFPEQAVNWRFMEDMIGGSDRPPKILNLFGYTGGATLACLRAGASVTHVDSSKGIMQWAKENARLSGLEKSPVRWITDDALKFVKRELRRGAQYDGIIMDPPSYGRGPSGEIWRLEDDLDELIESCVPLLSGTPLFFLVNTYNMGPPPDAIAYMLGLRIQKKLGGKIDAYEIGLKVANTGLSLPCGGTVVWEP